LLLHLVEPEKRALLLERITAKLDLHGAFTDRDLDQAIASAIADPPSRTGSLTFPQDAMHAALVFP